MIWGRAMGSSPKHAVAERQMVFLVDDDPDFRDSLAGLLSSVGIEVKIFGSAAELLANKLPDVVSCLVLDVRMPRLSGLEVLREIRASSDSNLHTVPVVVLTSSAAAQDVTSAYEQHANSYLVKPVDYAQFMQLIHDLGFYWLGCNYYAAS